MEAILPQNLKGYELRERIGAGGFGAVYRAYQSTVGREVAVKIILPGLANQPEFIRRFEGEAQIIARLEHPHIVPLHDYWRDPNGAYLVMRWLRGGSLRDTLPNGAYDLRSAALLLDQVAGALSLAHRNNVIHRDIKPGNILLDEDGNAYLTDFGIAKDLNFQGNDTQPDVIVGSLDYLSPEQARSEPITIRTDIYSLGVTLYEVITGTHPFKNLSSVERLYKHINDPLPDITILNTAVTAPLNRIIQKATAKNPEHRYPDALAFAVAFREAIGLNRVPTSAVELLTQREQEVLQLIIDGYANKEIAQRLTVTLSTVKWYVNQIYTKLGVRSRVQAMVRARELNLLTKSSEAFSFTSVATEDFYPENPYKGLRAFQSADNQDFFGREKVTEKLLKRLEEIHEFGRFLAVIGPSGSGKSSLIKAGLIPALWRGELSGSEKWFIVEMLPGAHPLDELEIALTRVAASQSGSLHEQLSRDRRGLIRTAQLILPNDGSELVLVIDQFEELFTLLEDEATRVYFLDLLYTAVIEPRSRVRIIITLRADFYDRPLHYADFGELVRSRMETVLPLSAQELERAISKPSERVGASFEPGLVATIVAEVNYQSGALPLLQYALTELFEQRNGRMLTREAYDAIGGSVGALARRADEVHLDFDDAGQEAARQMFLRLVTLGEGVEDTRRRVTRSELLAIAPDADVMDEVIDTYVDHRLLSLDNDPGTRSPTVEVAHEAILRAWERLRNWLNESRDEIKHQRQLSTMATEWHDSKHDNSFLARGARLAQFEKWIADTQLALTPAEQAYFDASISHRALEAKAEIERQIHVKILERRSVRFLHALVAVFGLAAFITSILSVVVINERNRTDAALSGEKEARSIVEVNLLALRELALVNGAQAAYANDDLDTARTLSLAANNGENASSQSQWILADTAYAPGTSRVYSDELYNYDWSAATLSPDRRYMLTRSYSINQELVIWDLDAGDVIGVFPTAPSVLTDTITVISFRPTPHVQDWQLLIGSDNGTVTLWNYERQQPLLTFTAGSPVWTADFSPDGAHIAAGSDDGTLRLWDVNSGDLLYTLVSHMTPLTALTFSPDGTRLLSASEDGKVMLWDVTSGNMLQEFDTRPRPIRLAFSPDANRFLVSTFTPFIMSLWDIQTGSEVRTFRRVGPIGWPFFSRDGQSVFSSEGNFITFWDINTGEVRLSLTGHTHAVVGIFPTVDESQILSVSTDGTIREWNLHNGAEIARTQSLFPYLVMDGQISPDGQTFAVAAGGSTVRDLPGLVVLYDTVTGTEMRRFGVGGVAHTASPSSVRFNPDGQTILSADWSGEIKLWDMTNGALLWSVEGVTSAVNSVEFTPDGGAFIASSDEGDVLWVDSVTGVITRRYSLGVPVKKAIFTRGAGRLLACLADESSSILVVDVETGETLHRMDGQSSACLALAIAPDDLTAVSGHGDGSILLWNLTNGQLIRRFRSGLGRITELAFSNDGETVFSGSFVGAAQSLNVLLWDVATGEPYRRYTSAPNPVDALDLSADGRTLLAGSYNGSAWLWRIDNLTELIDWTHANRYVPELTCEQRELYRIEPLCKTTPTSGTTGLG